MDWFLIKSVNVEYPPNPYTRHAASHWKSYMFSNYEKTLIAKILKRCLLVATKVPYKSQLTLESCHQPTLHAIKWTIYVLAQKWPITQMAISRTVVNIEFFLIFAKLSQIDWHLHANFWVKIPNIHCCRISSAFQYVKNHHLIAH